MPGHKNNRRGFGELDWIQDNLYKIDNTEIPGLDNLHMPEEMILEAQIAAARAFKSNRSYFLVNGSTSGIYSMILGVTKPGDKIIVQRNCHKSVFTACLLGDLETAYINPSILEDFGIAVSLSVDDVIRIMDENSDAKAIVLTYPTYYGTCMDLESIAREAHKRNILVLIDEAHGAHSYFSSRLPKGAMECGADVSVTSLHKTTPALTQTALLNTGNIEVTGIEFMLRTFQSTSPSYVFLASMDTARYIMEERGSQLIDELLDNISIFKDRISKLPFYKVLGIEHMEKGNIFDMDPTKIVIKSTIGGIKLDCILRQKYGLQVEMSDVNNIVALTSIGNDGESLEKLYSVLTEIADSYGGMGDGPLWATNTMRVPIEVAKSYGEVESGSTLSENTVASAIEEERGNRGMPVSVTKSPESMNVSTGMLKGCGGMNAGGKSNKTGVSMRTAYYSQKKRVRLKDAAGMVSSEMASPYPPGIPVLLPGEIITSEIIEEIYFYKNCGLHINGLSDKAAEYIDVAVF
jgi:arginine/lysine/ornithine decarboxylase